MTETLLRHADILAPGSACHMVRTTLGTRRPRGLHGHDFHELIWVQNGQMRHHLPETRSELSEGDLLFIRPGDTHALQARGPDVFTVSVIFDPALIADLAVRHPSLAGRLFWQTGPLPEQHHRDIRQLADLNRAALRLEQGDRSALAAEAFLLPLATDLADPAADLPEGAPGWLIAACRAAQRPEVFRDGAGGFARLTGRAHPHVSRTMRRFLNQSPSDFINAIRMRHAARQLTGSADTLSEIAADCGIPNLSHFHKLFRAHHGVTPQHYRRTHQREVVQPGQS